MRPRAPKLTRHCSETPKGFRREKKTILPTPKIKKKMLVYVIENKFEIVKKVAKQLGHKVTSKTELIYQADLVWNETSSSNPEILSKIENYQKLNHFPGICLNQIRNL